MSTADASPDPRRRLARVAGLLLFLAVLGLFLPALKNNFVNYDDRQYVTANAHVLGGLTWDDIAWAFRGSHAANWHPLTWLSHMADCQLYGLNPWGHHLTNVLLHALTSLLLFLVLRSMTGAIWRSLMVAALFGLHPLHVESVAWVAERKDVLSAFFWMLTLGAYVKWAEGRRISPSSPGEGVAGSGNGVFYGLALLCFALGLMSKAMVVSMPLVLLLLDYWPLDSSFDFAQDLRAQGRPLGRWGTKQRLGRLLIEKIPFFVLAAADAVVTVMAQKQAGAVGDLIAIPFGLRVENALISCCRYLGKIFWPTKLAVFYPYPDAQPLTQALGAAVLVLILTVLAVSLRRKHPYLLVGWFWYLLTLVPVIGLVQVGSQSMADRYAYLPSIGIFVAVVWGAAAVTRRWRRQAALLGAATTAVLLACALLTSRQIAYWTDSETLFRHALAVTDGNWLADNNLGLALADSGRAREAIASYEEALRLEPGFGEARGNLGNALLASGQIEEAVAAYREALRRNPDLPEAHNGLGNALVKTGETTGAIAQYRDALRLRPDYAEAQNNLANLLVLSNEANLLPEAIFHYEAAVRLKPDSPEIRNNLGCALARLGRNAEARTQFEAALRLKPDYAEARVNLEHLPNSDAAR